MHDAGNGSHQIPERQRAPGEDAPAVDVSVCIVSWNTRELLRQCIESIRRVSESLSVEVLVVDNGSTDGSTEMVRSHFPGATLIENRENLGFARASNQALERGRGRYFLLLNTDAQLHDGALEELVAFLDTHEAAGAATCHLVSPSGSTQRSSWRGFPSLRAAVVDAFYLWRIAPRSAWVRAMEVDVTGATSPIEVDHVIGACMLVRRYTVEQIGRLDESFFLFLEETDWCYRMRRAGWRVYVVPSGTALHIGQQSVHQDPERTLVEHFRSYVLFCRRNTTRSRSTMTLLKLVLVCGGLLRAGLWIVRSLRPEQRTQALRMLSGYWRVIRAVPSF